MSSILTNSSAMIALQNLRQINYKLENTQNRISTGLRISSARDNAGIWAVATVMQGDVGSFTSIQAAMGLATGATSTADTTVKSVIKSLKDISDQITSAQNPGVNRSMLQNNIDELVSGIRNSVNAGSFNGLNLLTGEGSVNVLGSIVRDPAGFIVPQYISFSKQNLEDKAGEASSGSSTSTAFTWTAGTAGTPATAAVLELNGVDEVVEGATYQVGLTIGTVSVDVEYVARAGDTINDIATYLNTFVQAEGLKQGIEIGTVLTLATDPTTGNGGKATITFVNNTDPNVAVAGSVDVLASDIGVSGGTAVATGGLDGLSDISVMSDDLAKAALISIQYLINQATKAGAGIGALQGKIDVQNEFIYGIIDALNRGIGSLIDADLESESARLSALQVQQQLSIQSLGIANNSVQLLVRLFQ